MERIVNRYAGECAICHQNVAAGMGVATKPTNGTSWVVTHSAQTWKGSPVSGGWVGGCPATAATTESGELT